MRLDRAWIERHIPHHGRMCLLDEVISWDADRISCSSGSHRAADNPLRARGQLGIACGIEYAAQAMAVHGALAGGALEIGPPAAGSPAAGWPAPGFLAGVRNVEFHVLRLDDVPGDLICDAVRVAGDRGTALYEFELRSAATRLLTGRATVLLEAKERMHL
ncbi:MAG: 3-hydroxylacyl-ACP dehydratase [Steroidobacteraceae bacterium]|jgi:predicted hotdog family 3-hydroxylacyl-ACP dehydratase